MFLHQFMSTPLFTLHFSLPPNSSHLCLSLSLSLSYTKFNTLSLFLSLCQFVYLCVCVELAGMHSGPITRPLQLQKGIYIYKNKTKQNHFHCVIFGSLLVFIEVWLAFMVEQFYVLILCFQVSNPFLVCSYPQFPFGGLHVVIIVNNDFFF